MKEKNRTKIIVAVIGLIGIIGGSVIGNSYGENRQEKYIQSQIANIEGNNNTVTINSVADLINEYNNLASENETLKTQNTGYFNNLMEANDKLEELESQVNDIPIFNYSNLALSVDGKDISINKNNSMLTVDGRDYLSMEIVEKVIPDDKDITIKDGVIHIGKVISDKKSLFDQSIVMDQTNILLTDNVTDSYGNNYSNVLYARSNYLGEKYIVFILNRQYSFLKLDIAIRDDADIDSTGIITVKADDSVVYTSEKLNKKTEPFTELDIAINNCNLLTIEYYPSSFEIDCIISDAVVYN